MSIIEQALLEWRRKRSKVSDQRETNIEAWMVELETALGEHGLGLSHLPHYLESDARSFVEKEYAQCEKKPPRG